MASPNVGILEEIGEQNLVDTSVGDAGANTVTVFVTPNCLASLVVGDEGWVCTATVECQTNC